MNKIISAVVKGRLAIIAASGVLAFQAQSQIVNLADLNSTVAINLGSQDGMFSWQVDGTSQIFQQWFWYRVGGTAEKSIDTIGAPVWTKTADHLDVLYANNSFGVQVKYTLTGGVAGSGVSLVGEEIRINNYGSAALDFHFFQYSDFDLGGTPVDDSVNLITFGGKYYLAQQSESGVSFEETVTTPGADHGEAGIFPGTLNKLNDGVASTLNDNLSAVLDDVTWAFQWDLNIAGGSSALISKQKRLEVNVIPEPSSLALIMLAAGAVGARRLGRKRV